MKQSRFAKKESIGQPELFCGRERELKVLLDWVQLIPNEQAKSRALLATKKMGKTAILDRLFNMLFRRGMEGHSVQVIPFFFRVGEQDISQMDFAKNFYFSFLTQILSFKCGEPKWVNDVFVCSKLKQIAREGFPQGDPLFQVVFNDLEQYEELTRENSGSLIWAHACSAAHRIASHSGEFILQILDEFQYLNKYIFVDELLSKQIDLAGSYHQWAESRIAPLLISGSWVGWLKEILRHQLNPRFKEAELEPFLDEEALECVYNYGKLFNCNLSEQSALAIQNLARNHPFYISCLIRSDFPQKDLSDVEGVERVLQYEVNHKRGEINAHWIEYIDSAFERSNGKYTKAIVLFLSKNRYQEKTRPEIAGYLRQKGLELEDEELEKKLKLLVRSDILCQGSNAFRFMGIPDDLFNQVFQVLYDEEIENIKTEETLAEIRRENQIKRETVSAKIFRQNKGYFLEFMMIRFLKYRTVKNNCPALRELLWNAPDDGEFFPYQTVGERHYNLIDGYHSQFDVVAKTVNQDLPSLLVECKYHEKPIDSPMVELFARKVENLKKEIPNLIAILYSVSDFTQPAKNKMMELRICWSTPEFWDVLSDVRGEGSGARGAPE